MCAQRLCMPITRSLTSFTNCCIAHNCKPQERGLTPTEARHCQSPHERYYFGAPYSCRFTVPCMLWDPTYAYAPQPCKPSYINESACSLSPVQISESIFAHRGNWVDTHNHPVRPAEWITKLSCTINLISKIQRCSRRLNSWISIPLAGVSSFEEAHGSRAMIFSASGRQYVCHILRLGTIVKSYSLFSRR